MADPANLMGRAPPPPASAAQQPQADEDDDEDTKRQIAQKQKQLQVFRVYAGMLGVWGAYVGAG